MKFRYVQIGCKDYQRLSDFYIKVCDFKHTRETAWLNGKKGIVLLAPGFSEKNPVYFGFVEGKHGETAKINDKGFAHTCFETTDVRAAIRRLVKYGGGFQSTFKKPENKPCVYCKDPEGNIVEFHIPFRSKGNSAFKTLGSLFHLKPDKNITNETGNSKIKFIHVNIISNDWKPLCNFYNNLLNSSYFGKMKDHQGKFKEKVIGIPGVHVFGYHLLVPGFQIDYPTIEVFTYTIKGRDKPCNENSLGINCIGFESYNLYKTMARIEELNGKIIKNDGNYLLAEDIQKDRIIVIRSH